MGGWGQLAVFDVELEADAPGKLPPVERPNRPLWGQIVGNAKRKINVPFRQFDPSHPR